MTCSVDDIRNSFSYSSRGTHVSGNFYRPQGTGPFPAVLVLHTRGGLSSHERDFSSWLTSQGYAAMAPDYFTPLGVTSQTFDHRTFYLRDTDRVQEDLARGLDCLKSLPFVDQRRIGVVGFSLGGYLGPVLASRDDVRGVVSYYGAYHGAPVSDLPTQYSWSSIIAQVRASVLMLHGEADTTALVQRARTTHQLLVQGGKQSELVVYPGAEHQFDQLRVPQYYNAQVTADAQAKTLAFLAARLK